MHFFKDNENKWHFLSKEGYEQSRTDLPPIIYATKYYIKDIEGKEWPEFDSEDLLEESKEPTPPNYIASIKVNNEKVQPPPKYNENEIFEKEVYDMNPLIFYRLARPLKDTKSLPELDLEKYHEKSDLYGLRVEADPDYSFMKNGIIMALEFEKYESIQNRIQNFDPKYDQELMKHIEKNLEMMQQNFIECPYVFLMVEDIEFEDQTLKNLPNNHIQSRIDSLVVFNQYLLKSLPFLIFDEELIHQEGEGETVLQTESLTA